MKTNVRSTHPRHLLKRGMTLLEIVVVLSIIAIIMVVAVPKLSGVLAGAHDQATSMQARSLLTNLTTYKMGAGYYPSQAQGLQALVTKPTSAPKPKRWKQQLEELPIDAWGNEFIYKFPGSKNRNLPEVISKGEDGELGSDDDISSQDS